MRWLIAEDSLLDRKGHWLEYIGAFRNELRSLGDEVTILADHRADPFLVRELEAQRVLPASIFRRMGDGAGPLTRYARVPRHAWQTWRWNARWLRRNPAPDLIFVPTVIVHHLWGWKWIIRRTLRRTGTRVLLFFPNTPVTLDDRTGRPAWNPAPTSRLFHRLIRDLSPDVASGRVILGAETHAMQRALTQLTGVTFTYLPHPVALPPAAASAREVRSGGDIVMGSYGSARHEKGTDVLIAGIEKHLAAHPDTRARFVVQVVDSFTDAWRRLLDHPRVEIIPDYFPEGEYVRRLAATDVLLLPYRASSYNLRVSRVVIEAMASGFPIVATRGTTLSEQVESLGAGVACTDGDAGSLAAAIHEVEQRYVELQAAARARAPLARAHFSVRHFREILGAPVTQP